MTDVVLKQRLIEAEQEIRKWRGIAGLSWIFSVAVLTSTILVYWI